VGDGEKVEVRDIQAAEWRGSQWLIEKGLQGGERVVVEGFTRIAPGAPQLHADIPGNLCFDFEYGDEARTEQAFARAAHVTRLTLESNRMVGNPMEPKACLAAYDSANGTYDLYSSTQVSRSCSRA